MKRQSYRATLTVDGNIVSDAVGYAWNSTVRKSEMLARVYARSLGVILHGGTPECEGEKFNRTSYRRAWSTDGVSALATVTLA